ncbi:MAG: hypothetical protein K9J16_05695 [Melioribacteraceae bacterium]|nr:hypothetical protein [Melioribacteraceae bacterium]MCF8353293.1 hypothetical protein [Melioribacteraceae bacterium]MCF8395408.1 hypothetical protein [Melioribacteraceae bacterium]MCF8418820.1 hypothetical protein [Melioribacteraceae bacterium]
MLSSVKILAALLEEFIYLEINNWKINPPGMKLDQLMTSAVNMDYDDSCWSEYKIGKMEYRDNIWIRKKIILPEKLLNQNVNGKLSLEFTVDDSAYCWINNEYKGFFTYDSEIVLSENASAGAEFNITFRLIKTAGLPNLAKAGFIFHEIDEKVKTIRKFILSLLIGEKLLSPDTYQTNGRNKIDPGIDKSKIDKQIKVRLNTKLQKLAADFDKSIIVEKSIDKIINEIERISPHLKEFDSFAKKFTLTFASNAHIDAAWLWRWRETVEAAAVTFSAVDKMMDQRDDFTFTQSSSVFYSWMEKFAPDAFQKIERRIKEKRWEVIGGTVVEPDCNLINGESWARQLLYGKNYFKEKFGVDETIGMNPDSFGYNGNLPMIYNKAGIDAFITQKIGWNETTVFPYRVFWWESRDGSRLLSYMPFNYDEKITNPFVFADWLRQFEANTGLHDLLIMFGIGDHGGGPTPEMFNRIDELKTLYIFPSIQFGTVKDYFSKLKQNLPAGLPVWNDELYLEYHQGTFTTQAELKKQNRDLENLLIAAEIFSVFAELPGQKKLLKTAWEKVLFNQFHDILPGSCIHEVVDDALEYYTEARRIAQGVLTASTGKIAGKHSMSNRLVNHVSIFNPSSFVRNDLAVLKSTELNLNDNYFVEDYDGNCYPSQVIKLNEVDYALLICGVSIPAFGFKKIIVKKTAKIDTQKSFQENVLENDFFKLTVNNLDGTIENIYDKANNRELLSPGGFRLQLLEDKPLDWDAWNIGLTGKKYRPKFEKIESGESGNVYSSIKIFFSFLDPSVTKSYPTKDFPSSFFTIEIFLYKTLKRVDFEIKSDWHERNLFLKAAVDLNLKNPTKTFEIPYGSKQRGSRKDIYDKAKTEVTAINWVDLSEPGYGISILNNSKYGYDFDGDTFRVSLLRSSKWPDDSADMGKHNIQLSLYPHSGSFDECDVVRKGIEFNNPLIPVSINEWAGDITERSFVNIDSKNIIISSIKFAENCGDTWIIHMYEIMGSNTKATLRLPFEPVYVHESNFIEEDLGEVKFERNKIYLDLNAYSIKVIKIKRP